MTPFWIGAGLLGLLAATLILLPLRTSRSARRATDARREENLRVYEQRLEELQRQAQDQDEFERARLELDRMLLADTAEADAGGEPVGTHDGAARRLLWLVAAAVPVLAVVLYFQLGSSESMRLAEMFERMDGDLSAEEREQRLEAMLPALESQARRHDPEGHYRFLLARTYMQTDRYPEAAAVFAELVELYPDDATLIGENARALYMASGRRMSPAVESLVERALAIDPGQVSLLAMVGMDHFQRGDYRGAIEHWQKLLDRLPPDAPDAAVIRDGVAMARTRLGEDVEDAAVPAGHASAAPAAAAPRLRVTVSLAQGMRPRPDDTVFVFARAVGGPPMPLAVARFPASELPREVELNDEMAMTPALKLSNFQKVMVVARVSRGGTPSAQPGDLEGGAQEIQLDGGEQKVAVLIDRTI